MIGVSGGLDSTQALIVAARTMDRLGLPRTNILGYTMPGFATSGTTRRNADALMRSLGITAREIDIRPSSEQMLRDIGHPYADGEPVYDVTFENVQAGERTSHLFRLANFHDALVLGTGDLSELALGWATYGVGDQMSHYNVNASVPKTLIQHLIRWISETGEFDEETNATLRSIVETEISPELVPSAAGESEAPAQSTEATIGPYELQDFNTYYITRFGFRPSKVAFLALHAWGDRTRGDWPDLLPQEQRNQYDLATIKRWLEVFLFRFFQISQFKRSAMPNGPEGGLGRLAVASRRLAGAERFRSHGLAGRAAPQRAGVSTERRQLGAPHEVVRIVARLEAAGHSTWAVGGAVRDALAGGDPQDWDFATAARPAEVQRIFRRTVPVGIEHGTVGVLGRDGRLYEVTTFRRDVETFGRRARVAFADTLEEDLERRDFTINAVAWHPVTDELRDPHGGRRDLADGVLRTVGEPEERFQEDRLRVLRALRFAGRFDLRVHDETWSAIRRSADHLGHLSAERIREELYKVLDAQMPSAALRLYARSGVLGALYPELQRCVGFPEGEERDLWEHLIRTVDAVRTGRRTLRIAALLHDVGRPVTDTAGEAPHPEHGPAGAALAREVMRRLKASNAETDRVVHLVALHHPTPGRDASDPDVRRWIRRVGPAFLRDLFRLRFADWRGRRRQGAPQDLLTLWRRSGELLRSAPPLSAAELAIGGAELRALGIPPGPLYGEILRDLLEEVTDDPALNTTEALTERVRERIS